VIHGFALPTFVRKLSVCSDSPPRRFRQSFSRDGARGCTGWMCIYRFSTTGATLIGLDRSRVRSKHPRHFVPNIHIAPLRYILSPSMRSVLRGYAVVFCSSTRPSCLAGDTKNCQGAAGAVRKWEGPARPCGCASHARAHDEAVLSRGCQGSCRGGNERFRCALAPFAVSCKFAQAAHPSMRALL